MNSNNRKSSKQMRIVRFNIHPLFLLVTALLIIFLIAGAFNQGSNVQSIAVSEFINGIKSNKYSGLQIQDSGEILAQDKYLLVADVTNQEEEVVVSSSTKLVEANDFVEIPLEQLVSELKPQDTLTQLRDAFSSSNNVIAEIVLGDNFIIIIREGDGAKSNIINNAGEKDFIDLVEEEGMKLSDIEERYPVNYLRYSLSSISLASFGNRAENAMFTYIFEVDNHIYGRLANSKIGTYSVNWDGGMRSFATLLQEEGISIATENMRIGSIVISSVPWGDIISLITLVGFIVLAFFLFRGVQSSGSGLMRFGQSKARMFWGMKPDATFKDVAGIDEAKEELSEIVDFLRNPGKFRKLGARIPKGVLMVGAPGTGKTLLARAIAGEAGVPFFHTSGSEFEEMLVGAGASRVRDLFDKAKKAAPALIFIDEIDAVARKRGTTIQSGTTEQTLNQILVEMDGFEKNVNVIVIAATNRPDVLDPAILRPGRFDRRVVIELPDIDGRKQILSIHAKGKPLAEDVDLEKLAKRTVGFSGADLENMLNEAAIITARRGKKEISSSELEEAAVKVTIGPAKVSRKRAEEEVRLVAVHEAGHAIVSKFVPNADPVHKVSIISRGLAGGVTHFLPRDDNRMLTRTKLLSRLVIALGGRAAEQVVLDDISTGASSDIDNATTIARNMVQKFGMSESLGLVKYGDSNEFEYLGYAYGEHKEYSDETAKMIDEEVRRLIRDAYKQALDILTANRPKLDKLVDTLLEKEEIDGDEFEKLF